MVFDGDFRSGGMMRSQIPKFRLPDKVIDEECNYILDLGVEFRGGRPINSLKALLAEGWDAVFVGSGAPRGRELDIPGREEATKNIHIGIDWLSSVSFGHVNKIGKRVIVLGGGNTAMDCCRSSRRLGGEDVKVIVRSGFEEMKASPWEKEDAMHEGIPIHNYLVPKEFTHQDGKLTGVMFEKVKAEYDAKGRRKLVPSGEPDQHFECDDVLVAVGQENSFPWIERDIGLEFDKWDMPKVDPKTFASTNPKVFFGGDAAFGPKNIIWAVAHGHEAAVSIDKFLNGEDVNDRPLPAVEVVSQKMGIHEWSYDNDIALDKRYRVPTRDNVIALKDIRTEVELGYDDKLAFAEAQRCLNCDVQTVFTGQLCIECDACVDICPMDCITFTQNGEEADLRTRLKAPAHEPHPGPLRRRQSQDRPRDGEGRGRVPALRAVRRALPDRRLGHAEIPDRNDSRGNSMPIESVNDFVVRFANVNGSGSASANELFARAVMRMGVPVSPAQHLPVEHPGAADLVRGAHHRGRASRRARRRRPDGRDEPADLRQGRRLDREGRLPVLRQHQAAARLALPRRHHGDRRPAHRDLQSRIHRSAPAPAVQEHHLCRRALGDARHGRRRDREADRRAVPLQGHADRAERARAASRPRLRD